MLNALHTVMKTVAARRAVWACVLAAVCASASAQELRLGRTMTTVAGLGPANNLGATNLPGIAVRYPGGVQGLALDSTQTHLYVSESHVVHRIDLLTGLDTVIAGTPSQQGFSGDGGPATSALLSSPQGLTLDAAGNLYIADTSNAVIRKVNLAGIISTLAGQGNVLGIQDGPAANATFQNPTDVKFDSNGALLIVDFSRVRKYTPATGMVTTVIDSNTPGFGFQNSFRGIAIAPDGTIYLSENFYRYKIYRFSGGALTTFAGSGVKGFNGDGSDATLVGLDPGGLALDASGNLYIADGESRRLREVGAAGNPLLSAGAIRTIAGDGGIPTFQQLLKETADAPAPGTLSDVSDVVIANNGVVYVGTSGNSAPGSVLALSYSNGIVFPRGATSATIAVEILADVSGFYAGTQATLGQTEFSVGASTDCVTDGSVVLHAGSVCHVPVTFTAAAPGRRMAQLLVLTNASQYVYGMEATGYVSQAMLVPGTIDKAGFVAPFVYVPGAGYTPPGPMVFNAPASIVFDQRGYGYIADTAANTIYSFDPYNNLGPTPGSNIHTLIGGPAGFAGDGGPYFDGRISAPTALALDAAGILYFADAGNHRVRSINLSTQQLSTVAGDGGATNANDGALATHASLSNPSAIALDRNGDLLIADSAMHRVRRVIMSTGVITTIAGDGTSGNFGDGLLAKNATVAAPSGVAVAPNGDIFISDAATHIVRRIDATTGIISAYAGNGQQGLTGNFVAPTSASLNAPQALLTDASGGLYIADTGNGLVRYVTHPIAGSTQLAQIITVAGSTTAPSVVNGGPATATLVAAPAGMALNDRNQLFIAEYTGHDFRTVTNDSGALVFPDTAVGQTSPAQTELVLQSGSTAPGNPTPFIPSLTAANADTTANYALNVPHGHELPLCLQVDTSGLKDGESCVANLAFQPESQGAKHGSVTVAEQGADFNVFQYITLSGNGTGLQPFKFNPSTIPNAIVETGYSQTIKVSGGTGSLLLTETGALPAGITFTSANGVGTLSGKSSVQGDYPFSITVTDANGATSTQNYDFTVGAATVALTVSEVIHVNDATVAQPWVQLEVDENIHVIDTTVAQGAIQVGVVEQLHVTDAPVVSPAVQIALVETLHVADTVTLRAALQIGIVESIHVADTNAIQPQTPASAPQTITFTGLSTTAIYGSAGPYTLNAIASSGLPITYTVTGPATRSGTILTITAPGTVSVTASQAGNAQFAPAAPVTQVIVIGTVQLTTTAVLSKISGGYKAVVTVANTGTGTAQNVLLTAATLGTASGTGLPVSFGNILSGRSAVVTVTFPASAGIDGAGVVEKLMGTYTGGTFAGSYRAILP